MLELYCPQIAIVRQKVYNIIGVIEKLSKGGDIKSRGPLSSQ